MNDNIKIIRISYLDSFVEDLEVTKIQHSPAMLRLRMADGNNRNIPMQNVRWFGVKDKR